MLDTTASTTRHRISTLVAGILRQHGGDGAVATDQRLVDAGFTSIDMVNLMLAVEAEFDIMIPPAEITPASFRSIATIEEMVARVAAADAA